MYKKILLPTDGSKFSEKSETHALFLADVTGADVIALSVVETNFSLGLPADDTIYNINRLLKEETQKNLERVKTIKEESYNNVDLKLMEKEGSPAEVILKVAEEEDVDLIVIGSSGKTGLQRVIMGSVAEKVVRSSKSNVLVIH
ncbi:MAG: universal stress protein [Methanobrevibacter sp.]|jgi:nucleotide-binding universal stress UspA family protein|nr:universal stress protein [Methanobrevibacter sp.]